MGDLRRARQVLGATRRSSLDELRKLYRKLALKTHPDKNGGDVEAFQRVANAYDVCVTNVGKSLTEAERSFEGDDRPTEYYDPAARRGAPTGRKTKRADAGEAAEAGCVPFFRVEHGRHRNNTT